jgi:hypothetical protein
VSSLEALADSAEAYRGILRSVCPIVAKTAIPTSGLPRMTDIAPFCDLIALSRDQKKLFPHFGEPGTAVFAVEDVEYARHDRTPLFDQCGHTDRRPFRAVFARG